MHHACQPINSLIFSAVLISLGENFSILSGVILATVPEKLSNDVKEIVHLVERDGNEVVYLHKFEPLLRPISITSSVGLHNPMYCTGVGKSIMAYLPEKEVRAIWDGTQVIPFTPKTITTWEALQEDLSCVRERGYAIDDEENELGIRCVALAVPGMNGRAEAAFSISGLAAQMTDDRIEHLARMGLAARQENTKKEKTRSEAAFRFASGRVFCCLCFLRAVLHRARFLCYCASRVSTAPGCVITRSPLCISSVSASCAKKT